MLILSTLQIASPACTELEMVMMDWLAKLLNLPQDFLSTEKGGGVIQVCTIEVNTCIGAFCSYTSV